MDQRIPERDCTPEIGDPFRECRVAFRKLAYCLADDFEFSLDGRMYEIVFQEGSGVQPTVKATMASAALAISHKNARLSRSINKLTGPVDAGPDIGIAPHGGFDQIDRPTKRLFKRIR